MRGFFRKLDEIDAVIKSGSSRDNALTLISMMTIPSLTIYTLNLLDASWVEPLESLGYFRERSSFTDNDEDKSSIFWPIFRFLRRVATENHGDHRIAQTLSRILSFIPTPNSFAIVRDMIAISATLPREMRRGILPVVQRTLSRSDNVEFVDVSALIVSLAEDGDVSPALRLFGTAFAVFRSDPKSKSPTFPSPAKAFMDNWNYRQEMRKCLPTLMHLGGMSLLGHLCQLLDEQIRIDTRDGFQGPDDYSYIWRPAIDEHGQNTYDDPRDTVITAIRDCATFILAQAPSRFSEIIEMLDSQQWFIFTRIMLYLLAESPSATNQMIAKYSAEPYLFSEVGVRHEYSLLLKNHFKLLPVEQQGAIFEIIERGPDQTSFVAHVQRNFKRSASEEERTSYLRRWQYDWLSYINADLPTDWRNRFENLRQEFGELDNPSFPVHRTTESEGGWLAGPVASKGEHITVETLLEQANSQRGTSISSPEELWLIAQQLRHLTEEDRETIGMRTEEVTLLPVMLVDAIASGLLAPTEKSEENLPTTLRLVTALAAKAAAVEDKTDQESLLELATRIIYQLVSSEAIQVNQEGLQSLTTVMASLFKFIKSGPTGHPHRSSDGTDPLRQAINTMNGRIVEGAIKVALLERKVIGAVEGSTQSPKWLFDNLSEMLFRLDPQEKNVSAIIGYRFPSLVLLSPSWAAEYAQYVFPLSATQSERWSAAWGSYVMYSGAHDKLLEILRPQYAKAIEQLAGNHLPSHQNQEIGLAQHLAGFYWTARITLKDQLFQDFMLLASEGGISAFLSTIGRGIRDGAEIPLAALRELADWTLSTWKSRRRAAKKALSAFGWWFPHPVLGSPGWRLEFLRKATTRSGSAQNLDQVLTGLEQLASELPDPVLRCLRALALGSPNESTSYHLASRSAVILEKAAKSASTASTNRIGEIADHFGSLGHFEYRRFSIAA